MNLRDLTTPSANITQGWVNQPNGRGTFDILQSCVITVLLCSWSVLVLNVPNPKKGRWRVFLDKMCWMAFTLIFPEVTAAMAVEQCESASQSVEDFSRRGYQGWTMQHAFFADMGGFVLQAPDFPLFPVDTQQILYLVTKHYIDFPDVDLEAIKDKNKADGFARLIMILQTTWFTVQYIARAIQHLSISTLELAVLGSVFCTYITTFLWRKKPLDVRTPILLKSKVRIADILVEAKDRGKTPYIFTPLDFVNAPPGISTTTPFWHALKCLFGIELSPKTRPIKFFHNNRTTPPRGSSSTLIFLESLGALTFVGLNLIGWNFTLPTKLELFFWRIANCLLVAFMLYYVVALNVVSLIPERVGKLVFRKETHTFLDLLRLCPPWLQIFMTGPAVVTYSLGRLFIIAEALAGLRALPTDAYAAVDWTAFIPHI